MEKGQVRDAGQAEEGHGMGSRSVGVGMTVNIHTKKVPDQFITGLGMGVSLVHCPWFSCFVFCFFFFLCSFSFLFDLHGPARCHAALMPEGRVPESSLWPEVEAQRPVRLLTGPRRHGPRARLAVV